MLAAAWALLGSAAHGVLSSETVMGFNLIILLSVMGRGLAQAYSSSPSLLEPSLAVAPELTSRPVIGVLSLEPSPTVRKVMGDHDSYIAASYVKFVEGAGGQVAPILLGQPPEYYRQMVQRVNGLLFPGGAIWFDGDSGYERAGRQLYRLAKELNEREGGEYLPLLGICLGMELMAVEAAGEDLRVGCTSEEPLPLNIPRDAKRNSRMFGRAPSAVVHTLERNNATANHHRLCITPQGMESRGLGRDWRTLALSRDAKGMEFVSVFEHRRLPLYGVMFHPEKNIYEWKRTKNYPHSQVAVSAAQYFADFLVSEARRNSHSFPEAEERSHLIYRHRPTDTEGRLMWEQLYLFDNAVHEHGHRAERRETSTTTSAPSVSGKDDEDFDV